MKPEKAKGKEKVAANAKKNTASADSGFVLRLFVNVAGGIAAIIFVYIIFQNVQGYDWLYNTMLKGSLETINDIPPDATVAQKYEIKWGGKVGYGEISYVNKIVQQTPDSAIILMPAKKLLTQVGLKGAVELPWLTYFVYPRKVVYEDDVDTKKLYPLATYIVSVNGWGLDKLNYMPAKPEGFMVLPIKK